MARVRLAIGRFIGGDFPRLPSGTKPAMKGHVIKLARWRARLNQGQGMTEYIIIVVLIIIAAIGVYSFFGQTTRQPAADMAKKESPPNTAPKEAAGEKGASQAPGKASATNEAGDATGGAYK